MNRSLGLAVAGLACLPLSVGAEGYCPYYIGDKFSQELQSEFPFEDSNILAWSGQSSNRDGSIRHCYCVKNSHEYSRTFISWRNENYKIFDNFDAIYASGGDVHVCHGSLSTPLPSTDLDLRYGRSWKEYDYHQVVDTLVEETAFWNTDDAPLVWNAQFTEPAINLREALSNPEDILQYFDAAENDPFLFRVGLSSEKETNLPFVDEERLQSLDEQEIEELALFPVKLSAGFLLDPERRAVIAFASFDPFYEGARQLDVEVPADILAQIVIDLEIPSRNQSIDVLSNISTEDRGSFFNEVLITEVTAEVPLQTVPAELRVRIGETEITTLSVEAIVPEIN